MNGNRRFRHRQADDSRLRTVIGARVRSNLLPAKGKSPTIALSRRAPGERRLRDRATNALRSQRRSKRDRRGGSRKDKS